jgi:hypothetical protein
MARIADTLGEDSYLYEYFYSGDVNDLLDNCFTFFAYGGPYDYENLGLTDDDGEIAVPEEEMEDLDKFFASNALLIDFKYSSEWYYHCNSK